MMWIFYHVKIQFQAGYIEQEHSHVSLSLFHPMPRGHLIQFNPSSRIVIELSSELREQNFFQVEMFLILFLHACSQLYFHSSTQWSLSSHIQAFN